MKNSLTTLKEIALKKETEWRDVQQLQLDSLEEALKSKEKQLRNENIRYRKLKEDFDFNLKLLEERDQELSRYDAIFADIKTLTSQKDAEISELKIKVDELKGKLLEEAFLRDELQKQHRSNIKEHQVDLERHKAAKNAEIEQERTELEKLRRDLQLQARKLDEELQTQQQELTSGFDDALRKREHTFRLKTDELSNSLLTSELQVKLLSKEIEILKDAMEKTKENLTESESTIEELRKCLKEKEWELKDSQSINGARTAELESTVEQLMKERQRDLSGFERKHAELARYAQEREKGLLAAKEAYAELDQDLKHKLHNLQLVVESKETELQKQSFAHIEAMKERDLDIRRLHTELAQCRSDMETQAAQHAQSITPRENELKALRDQNDKLRTELTERHTDIDRYKEELSRALERESARDRANIQQLLDLQRRCEDAERAARDKQEDFVKQLIKSRDEAVALSKERERELHKRDDALRVLTLERDRGQLALQRHESQTPVPGPSTEGAGNTTEEALQGLSDTEKVLQLAHQNKSLRQVIGRMTQDMQELVRERANSSALLQSQETKAHNNQEYVTSLEAEVRDLKSKLRALELKIESNTNRQDHRPKYKTEVNPYGGMVMPEDMRYFRAGPNVAHLESKLRQASQRMAQLAKEKQQLIQMGNRLRAELNHLRGRPRVPPPPQPQSPRHDVPLANGNTRREGIHNQYKMQLEALERLQYELTTQQLKIAQRGTAQDKQTIKTAVPDFFPTETAVKETQVERRSEDMPLSPRSSFPVKDHSPVESTRRTSSPLQNLMTSSSEGQSTLQEVWKLLDEESPLVTPRTDLQNTPEKLDWHGEPRDDGDDFVVEGKMTGISQKKPFQRKPLSQKAAGKFKTAQKKPVIRNYNIKD